MGGRGGDGFRTLVGCVLVVVTVSGCGSSSAGSAATRAVGSAAGVTTTGAAPPGPELKARLAGFAHCVRSQRDSATTGSGQTLVSAAAACLASVFPDPNQRASLGSGGLPSAPPSTLAGTKPTDLPVFQGDFADPSVLVVGTTAYAYATNTPQANVPVLKATLAGGPSSVVGDALPTLPSWTEPGWVWAPSVLALSSHSYVLYYTTRDRASQRQCISVATATSPAGPFVDRSKSALICQVGLGGSIDPSTVTDGTTNYLVWKSDGNCCSLPTTIWSQPLRADGLAVTGSPTAMIHNDQAWESGVVEGPSMVRTGNGYDLLFSGGKWDTAGYGMGFAACATPTGPCQEPSPTPFLASSEGRLGPGGGQVFMVLDRPVMVYAAWTNGKVGYADGGVRSLFVSPIDLTGAVPKV